MLVNIRKFHSLIIIMGMITSVHFWGLYHNISDVLYDIIDVIFYIVILLTFTQYILNNKSCYKLNYFIFHKPILYFYFFLLMSSISSWVFHEQIPPLTIIAMRFFVFLLLYYVLMIGNIGSENILKLVFFFALIYMCIFVIQLIVFPHSIVPLGNTTQFDRGFLRLRLEGVGFVTLLGYYMLNKHLLNKKIFPLLIFALCFLFVFILGFRTLLLTYTFSALILVALVQKSIKKILVMSIPLIFLMLIIYQLPFVQNFINISIFTTTEHLNAGEEYIRFLTFDFLFKDVNVNWITILLGNGQPFVGTTYGNYVGIYGAKVMGYIAADLGLVGFVFNYGLISCLLFLNIFFKGIFTDVQSDSSYLKVFFIYLIISSFTTAEIFRAGMFGPVCVALYLINISNFKMKYNKESK